MQMIIKLLHPIQPSTSTIKSNQPEHSVKHIALNFNSVRKYLKKFKKNNWVYK